MHNQDVIFDIENQQIGLIRSDCSKQGVIPEGTKSSSIEIENLEHKEQEANNENTEKDKLEVEQENKINLSHFEKTVVNKTEYTMNSQGKEENSTNTENPYIQSHTENKTNNDTSETKYNSNDGKECTQNSYYLDSSLYSGVFIGVSIFLMLLIVFLIIGIYRFRNKKSCLCFKSTVQVSQYAPQVDIEKIVDESRVVNN